MAPIPTIVNGARDAAVDKRRSGQKKPESGLVCRVKFCNTLPDIPFEPKFLAFPFESSRFTKYNPSSLERNYKHELLTELDLGVSVDLVNQDLYKTNLTEMENKPSLALEDAALIADEGSSNSEAARRSRHHAMNVSWLRKTEYISAELNKQNLAYSDKSESKIGYNVRKKFSQDVLFLNRDQQIEAIEKTFEDTKKPVEQHYSKPNTYAVEVMPILPDFELWQHPCAQVIFDSDPAPKPQSDVGDVVQAMIRGMVDEQGDQFVAYFLPTSETSRKRKRDADAGVVYNEEDVYDYELTREYNWNVKNKTMRGYEENYFLVMRDGSVYYNELETRVRLNKRRKLGQAGGAPTTKTKLMVKHRDFTDSELQAQTSRMSMLEPMVEEEEEEEEGSVGGEVPAELLEEDLGEQAESPSSNQRRQTSSEPQPKQSNSSSDLSSSDQE